MDEKEFELLVGLLRKENDIVRFIDPYKMKVISFDEDEKDSPYCTMLWGRKERCRKCSSLKAMRNEDKAYKLEICFDRTYLVTSRFVKLKERSLVIECINDVSNRFLLDTGNKDDMGLLISHYNNLLLIDTLTGAYNRRYLEEVFIPSLDSYRKDKVNVNLVMFDIDEFKGVNDKYGHLAGDKLLKDVALYLRLCFSSNDKYDNGFVVRYGGDEILLIACGPSKEIFSNEVDNCYLDMRKTCYTPDSPSFSFSITYGIASSLELDGDWGWDDLLQKADSRMYRNKMLKKRTQVLS